MNAFTNHLSFEFRTGVPNKQLLLMNYLFPLGFYLMMGFVMPVINPSSWKPWSQLWLFLPSWRPHF